MNGNELAKFSDLKNSYPNINCDVIDKNFDLNSNFAGWRRTRDTSYPPKNAPTGILGTAFYLQMHANPIDPNTCMEIAIGLAFQPMEGNDSHPHIWVRQCGWQVWTPWYQIC